MRLNNGVSQIRTFLLALPLGMGSVTAQASPAEEYRDEIRPILEQHCYECHGPEKHKADLNLASFLDYTNVLAMAETWQLVLERVQAFEMPPETKPELGFTKHQKLLKWLRVLPRPERP